MSEEKFHCNLCDKTLHIKSKQRHLRAKHSNSNSNSNNDVVKIEHVEPIYKSNKIKNILKHREDLINEINNRKENQILKLKEDYEYEFERINIKYDKYIKKEDEITQSLIKSYNKYINEHLSENLDNIVNEFFDDTELDTIDNVNDTELCCSLTTTNDIKNPCDSKQQKSQFCSIKMNSDNDDYNPTHKINKTKFNHHINLPRCFRMLIVGSSGCGKTNLLLKMLTIDRYNPLTKSQDNFLDYDNLLIFSKTISQPEYQYILNGFENNLSKKSIRYIFKNQENLFYDEDGNEKSIEEVIEQYALKNPENSQISVKFYNNVNDVISPEQLPKSKKNLIIFDDCINEKNQNIMEKYFTRGRHQNVNVIYLSQSWFDLDKRSIRANSNYIILFKLNKKDKSLIYSDLLSNTIDQSEFDDLTKIWNERYKYIAFNTEGDLIIRDDVFKY